MCKAYKISVVSSTKYYSVKDDQSHSPILPIFFEWISDLLLHLQMLIIHTFCQIFSNNISFKLLFLVSTTGEMVSPVEVLGAWDIQKNMDLCGMIFNVKITLPQD